MCRRNKEEVVRLVKVLCVLDETGYTKEMPVVYAVTVRAVIEREGRYAMQLSGRGEYKIPGGGVEQGEDLMTALEREVLEETGLIVIPETVSEIGEIIEYRPDKFSPQDKFERHTFYYRCQVREEQHELQLTPSELDKEFQFVWEKPEIIYEHNRELCKSPYQIRDTIFMKMLLDGEV